jgi:hypothetical protein
MVNAKAKRSLYDTRDSIKVDSPALRKIIDQSASRPLVNNFDLGELGPVFEVLPELTFPITSAGHLLDQVANTVMTVHDIELDPSRLIKYMPSYYFPISSYDNLIEKLAELVRANRQTVDAKAEVKALRRQIPPLSYPVNSAQDLIDALGTTRTYRFLGGVVDVKQMTGHIPDNLFPIRSDSDLDTKLAYLINRRPLIVGHKRAGAHTP